MENNGFIDRNYGRDGTSFRVKMLASPNNTMRRLKPVKLNAYTGITFVVPGGVIV